LNFSTANLIIGGAKPLIHNKKIENFIH